VLLLLNTLLALPSVVVGLAVYLLLSRSGPLGAWGILFTPTAMVIAQTILVFPVVAALSRQLVADALREARDPLRSMGASPFTAALLMLLHERWAVVMVLLTAFGRAIAEVGAVMIVGGNIDGVTRVMTTAIALETSKGDLPLALALGLVLLAIVALLNLAIAALPRGSGAPAWRAAA
jgi:ABC-type tungstate transport system substrate-binding protein